MTASPEQVAVVTRVWAEERELLQHGFRPIPDGLIAELASVAHFVPRAPAETNPALKQLIPYVVVRRGGEVFCTERLSRGNEARLHGKLSIGIGGHINPGEGADIVNEGMRRELHEELALDVEPDAQLIGLINDDTTDVGSVHWGLVFIADLPDDASCTVRETHKLAGSFRSLEWLEARREGMETWSVFALEAIRAEGSS